MLKQPQAIADAQGSGDGDDGRADDPAVSLHALLLGMPGAWRRVAGLSAHLSPGGAVITVALLDLDGTIADSRPGIIASVRHAVRSLGHELNPNEDLGWAIGPPIDEVMTRILRLHEDSRVEEAIRLYRDRYGAIGLYEATIYADVAAVLHSLAEAGIDLILATSKRRGFAERVLIHFGLAGRFRSIYGSEPGGMLDEKSDLLAHLLTTERLRPRHVIMIGDRSHDIVAAHANGVRAIGVLWGYGSQQELISAEADALAASPSDLPELIAALDREDNVRIK